MVRNYSSADLPPYFRIRLKLSVEAGCVLRGNRVIVPSKGRSKVLHEAHPGIDRMKCLIWEYVWWPKIDSDIEHMVKSCNACQLNRKTPEVPLTAMGLAS